jgi:ribosomal protein L29
LELTTRTNEQLERDLIDLFSASPVEESERFLALIRRLETENPLGPSLMKHLGSRLAHHLQWDALFHLSRLLGVQKLKAEFEKCPGELRSEFAARTLSSERLAVENPHTVRQIKRDMAILTTFASGEDVAALAAAFLGFATSAPSKSKQSIAKFAARSIALALPEDAVILAIDSGKFSSLQLARLVDLVAQTPSGAKHALSFIARIAKSKRSETLEIELCWQRLNLLEIAQLTKVPEVFRHLSAQPAWWTARQRRELTNEGVGAIMRFVDGARSAKEVTDAGLLGEFLNDSKRVGNMLIRQAFDSVVTAALDEQSTAHEASLADIRKTVAERDAAIESAKAEQAQLQARVLRLEEDLRTIERSEIQSRAQKDAIAQRVMTTLIVKLILAMERLNENASEIESVMAFSAEAEALIRQADLLIERDSSGTLISVRQVDKTNKETILYHKS